MTSTSDFVVSGLCSLARRKGVTDFFITQWVAQAIWLLWVRDIKPALPDDVSVTVKAVLGQPDTLAKAARLCLDMEYLCEEGEPPVALNSELALLALAMTVSKDLFQDAYDFAVPPHGANVGEFDDHMQSRHARRNT